MKEVPRHLQKFILQIHHKNDIQGTSLQLHNNFDSIKRNDCRVSVLVSSFNS
jgi:hypothetical protein